MGGTAVAPPGKDAICQVKYFKNVQEIPCRLRIPDDADQRSELMPITHSGRCRSVIPGDADHLFRDDRDQWIVISGRVIAIPRNIFHREK